MIDRLEITTMQSLQTDKQTCKQTRQKYIISQTGRKTWIILVNLTPLPVFESAERAGRIKIEIVVVIIQNSSIINFVGDVIISSVFTLDVIC